MARILAHEGHFLVGPDWRWNYFDSTIVLISILERLVSVVGNSSVFRLLRIMRLSRSTRTMRLVRFFPSLYPLQFMMLSCANSLPALGWTCLLVLILLFLFSSVLTSGIAHFVGNLTHTSETAESLRRHFANVPMCMLTLFLSFIGEVEFRDVILSLLEVDTVYCVLYVMFLIFVTLAVMNVVNGIFISEAMELASQDREIRQRGELIRSRKNLQMLSTIFREMDPDDTGFIGKVDFEEQLQRPVVQSLLSFFNFDVTDATAFFKLLDVDENGCVDIEEFTVGCLRMHGKSNAIDMEISIQETKRLVLSIAQELRGDPAKFDSGRASIMEASRGHKSTLVDRMTMMEESLLGIEERLGIRHARGHRLVR
uniref:EF-hand domain-containing protein n=1 Tax=Noctiluca scintillans TaxID=2966 RepID=A0A7S1F4Z2_NOCSC